MKTVVAIFCLSITGVAHATLLEIKPDAATGKDAEIADGNLSGTNLSDLNFGDDLVLINNYFGNLRSVGLLEFDLGLIPTGASINSVMLGLFQNSNPNNQNSRYDAFRVTSPWNEDTVTFNTAPTFNPMPVASMVIPDSATDVYRTWDVTGIVSDWIDGSLPNYGFWIEEVPVQGGATAFFLSSDVSTFPNSTFASSGPKLTVDYTSGLIPEPGMFALFGLGLAGLGWSRRKKS